MPFPWINQRRRAALQHTIEKDQPGGYVGVDSSGIPILPPAPHAASHEGGSDSVDVTQLDGFPGGTGTFLRADRSFAAPAGGGGGGTTLAQTLTIASLRG